MNFDTLEATKERLENWHRCFREHIHYRVTASLEGRYKPPPVWHPPEPKIFIDTIDAGIVELAVIGMPASYKALLKYHYFTPYIPLNVICRKVKIRADYYNVEIEKAIRMVDDRLRK